MSILQDLESAIFERKHGQQTSPAPQRKALGRLLVLVGASSQVQVPVTRQAFGGRRFRDVAVRPRRLPLDRCEALKGSALLERRQWRADEALTPWSRDEENSASLLLEEWLQVLYADFRPNERLRQALSDTIPAAIQDIKAKLADGKHKELLLKSLHWLFLQSDYLVLKDRFGLCLPVLLQMLESSTDSTMRFLGWDVLNLLLDRAIATEVQNFAVPLADFFQCHSPYPHEEISGLSMVPYSQSFVQFLTKAFGDKGSQACLSQEKQLEHFLTFGFFHCRSAESEAFILFLEFGLLPLLVETPLLAPKMKELLQELLQSCEGPKIFEVLLSWKAIVLLFEQLPQRLARYAQDILLRSIFSYLTFLVSDPPEGLEAEFDLIGFRSPVTACMTRTEWEEGLSRREELKTVLGEVLKMLAQHQHQLFRKTLMELQSASPGSSTGSSLPAAVRTAALPPHLHGFIHFAEAFADETAEAGTKTSPGHEWTDFSVKLGGPGVEIIYASFQAIEDSNKRVDVTGRFNCYLYKKGFVWLSTHGLPDPACGRWKRLVVIYEGDNEYRTSSALWGASTAAMINLTVKAQALGVSQSLGSVLCHPLTDCLQIPALVMPVLALAAVAYRCYNKGFPLFEDGICVICLCHLERPAEVLSCGHAFHFNCIRSWLALGGCCPLCRKEPEDPALDALMHETTNALMMLGLFSHELSSWVPQLVQSLW